MRGTLTLTNPQTPAQQWYFDNREKYDMGIHLLDAETDTPLYMGGEYVRFGGIEPMFNHWNGCGSRDLDECCRQMREYFEGDHQ